MNKNIVYCLCCYKNKEIEHLFVEKIVSRYIKLFEENEIKTDFKIINFIPNEINDRINTIQNFYEKNNIKQKSAFKQHNYIKWLNKKTHNHIIKIWNTKFYLINQFFNSNYESMLYLDCDLLIEKPPRNLNLSNSLSFKIKKKKPGQHQCTNITQKYLPSHTITKQVQAGNFYINKNYSFNLEEILNLNEIQTLWEKDSYFLREETVLTYLFNKHNLINKITKPPMEYNHIGSWKNKMNYLNYKEL